ncbi:hypothetical protein Q5O14_08950 [Eubacteriaceae bacterium ES2]|nr:hypothetical protein Q5O14_08950 [Eubacteriaceae bacterium ES2]
MKLKKISVWFVVLVFILALAPLVSASGVNETATNQETIAISYRAHVQNLGSIPVPEDSFVTGPETVGSSGQGLRLEALWIELTGDLPNGAGISYQVHVQNKGWMDPVDNGQLAGTTGESLQIEAIRISLTNLEDYDVYYRGHVQNYGNLPQTNDEWGWVKNGETLGTTEESLRLEQIEIKIVKRDSDFKEEEEATVILADGSFGTAGDGEITDLPAGQYLFTNGDKWYYSIQNIYTVSFDDLDLAMTYLSLSEPSAGITSITGLSNGGPMTFIRL